MRKQQNNVTTKSMLTLIMIVVFVLQIVLLPIALPYVSAQTNSKSFGTNIRVNRRSKEFSDQVEPTMTILSDGRILAGWKEAEEHRGPGKAVSFAYSDNGGSSFSKYTIMDNLVPGSTQSDPWLIKDSDDNAYFVRLEARGSVVRVGEIVISKTSDGGETWGSVINASTTIGFDDKETACVDSDGNIYIAWTHTSPYEHVFTRSTDGGQNFIPTKKLTTGPFHGYIHASPNNTIYLTTAKRQSATYFNQIWLTKSVDQGDNWTTEVMPMPQSGEISRITVTDTDSQENVYIVFAQGAEEDKEIYLIKSEDAGATWSTPVQVNDNSAGDQRMPEMYIGQDDIIHIAWLDASMGVQHYYYSYSTDGGLTFSDDECVTEEGFDRKFTRPGDYFCMRQAPNGDMCMVFTAPSSSKSNEHDIYFARQGLNKFPVWAIATISGGSVLVIAAVVTVLLLKRKRQA